MGYITEIVESFFLFHFDPDYGFDQEPMIVHSSDFRPDRGI
jgi:hypothetical protein